MTRLLLSAMALPLFLLVGCQNAGEQPEMMSNRPEEARPAPINAPDISPEMKRFDWGIGDTATETGGGGDRQGKPPVATPRP